LSGSNPYNAIFAVRVCSKYIVST